MKNCWFLFFWIFLGNSYTNAWGYNITHPTDFFSYLAKQTLSLNVKDKKSFKKGPVTSTENSELKATKASSDRDTKSLPQYLWRSKNTDRSMEIHFVCDNKFMDISIKDPQQADYVKGYPAYIKMSVEYSPVLDSKNDLRLEHIGGVFLKTEKLLKLDRKHIPQFLENLRTLHLQDIKNKSQIKKQYQQAVQNCESLKDSKKDSCYANLTHGAYLFSEHPVILLNVISQVIPPKNPRRIEVLARFDSAELFRHLKNIPCYQAKSTL